MKKVRSFFKSPMGTTFLFMLAVLMLMTGTIGGVRATPQIFNPDFYYGGVELQEIGITLVENGNDISSRDYKKEIEDFVTTQGVLLKNMFQGVVDPAGNEIGELVLGYPYGERLSVRNSGEIPEYIRVSVYKYWTDSAGNKNDTIPIEFIDLNFVTGDNGWVIDQSDSNPSADDSDSNTRERTMLYYKYVVPGKSEGGTTTDFTDTLKIDPRIIDYAEKVYPDPSNPNSWTWSWVADGNTFQIEVEADAVQNHNAKAAIKSAWGLTDADIARLGLVFGPEES